MTSNNLYYSDWRWAVYETYKYFTTVYMHHDHPITVLSQAQITDVQIRVAHL